MTQNDKDLLLKDLCARLPYGVKIQSTDENIITLTGIILPNHYTTINGVYSFCDCCPMKPYLFPISSMTEEQKEELNDIFDLDVEVAIMHIKNDIPNYLTGINRLNWFLRNHFDIYGLIPMNLAIDATGLNIY